MTGHNNIFRDIAIHYCTVYIHVYYYVYVQLLPAIMKDFSDVARGSVSDEELTRAKSVNHCCVIFKRGVCLMILCLLFHTETSSRLVT